MNQQSFANFTGIAPATLSSILKGNTRPTLQVVENIKAKMSRVDTNWLLFGTGSMFGVEASQNDASSDGTESTPIYNSVSREASSGILDFVDGTSSDQQQMGVGQSLFTSGQQQLPGSQRQSNAGQQYQTGMALDASSQSASGVVSQRPAGSASGVRQQRQSMSQQVVDMKNIDKQQRRITEIRVFYDDQTWESFVPKK